MRAFALRLGSAAPLGLNKYVSIINPGLAPWVMQEYRPYRAPLRLPNHFIILIRFPDHKTSQSRLRLLKGYRLFLIVYFKRSKARHCRLP